MKSPAVYLLTNRPYGTLYVGVTSDLIRRIHQHRTGETTGFAFRYACTRLIWFEQHDDIAAAIQREKRIKGGSRARKLDLIHRFNPTWRDL